MIFGRKTDKNESSSKNKQKVKTFAGKALRYSHLPGIIPRIRELAQKFGHFAYMLALVYRAVNLLPANHPYLNTQNVGKYGLRDVIAAAANNVQLKRENIDQIAVFSAVLMSVMLVGAQVVVIVANTVITHAQAATFFETPNPQSDVVFIFLRQVFGDLGVFGTGANTIGLGSPVHAGLHAMLAFYSMAMLILAVFIIIYYIITVIGEAAISGTPFGRRFNSLWAPIRLVVALGLLVPVSSGLNSAQYIALYTAKMGSGLATNAWDVFVGNLGAPTNVFIRADSQKVSHVVRSVFVAEICAKAVNQINDADVVVPRIVIEGPGGTNVRNLQGADAAAVHAQARSFGADSVRFTWTADTSAPYDPQCSGLTVPVTPMTYRNAAGATVPLTFSDGIQIAYIGSVISAHGVVQGAAQNVVDQYIDVNRGSSVRPLTDPGAVQGLITSLVTAYNTIQTQVDNAIQASNNALVPTGGGAGAIGANIVLDDVRAGGWGKAGLWYPLIGRINQRYASVAAGVPTLDMPAVEDEHTTNLGLGGRILRWFRSWFSSSADLEMQMDRAMNRATEIAEQFEFTAQGIVMSPSDQNVFEKFVGWMFGMGALYDFQTDSSATLDPVIGMMEVGSTQLVRAQYGIGVMIAAKMGGAAAGAIAGATIGNAPGAIAGAIIGEILSAVFEAIGLIGYLMLILGLGAGMLLFYVLPMMPFIYFIFAVVAWVMELFEAMVAVPLWALSHLKIDGDGMPGPLAINGYFLLLGILLRPVLIVFGMIGGYIIFGAAVFYLHSVYGIIIDVLRGDEQIGMMGDMIYAMIYVYLCYNLAMMCFKMIDNVPKGILRWIGQGGATPFSDEKPDPIQGSQSMVFAAAAVAQNFRLGQGSFRQGMENGRGIPTKGKPSKSAGISGGGGSTP